jgi:hypothetical protein
LSEHDPPHMASIFGTFHGWTNAGEEETVLPDPPYRWAPSFPRDER